MPKVMHSIAVLSLAAGAVLAGGTLLRAIDSHHTVVHRDALKWGAAPASIPPGAQAAVLYGDPGKEEMFAFRLKFPKDYHIPPHTHPKPEIVTVLSGTFYLGTGRTADRSKAEALPAGSFFVMSPGMEHFAYADDNTVVQLNSTGPWGITYVNAADDPRKK